MIEVEPPIAGRRDETSSERSPEGERGEIWRRPGCTFSPDLAVRSRVVDMGRVSRYKKIAKDDPFAPKRAEKVDLTINHEPGKKDLRDDGGGMTRSTRALLQAKERVRKHQESTFCPFGSQSWQRWSIERARSSRSTFLPSFALKHNS